MTDTGTVAWFDLTKQFGFVALSGGGDAFLHMSVLKEAGFGTRLDSLNHPTFPGLDAAQDWIQQRLASRLVRSRCGRSPGPLLRPASEPPRLCGDDVPLARPPAFCRWPRCVSGHSSSCGTPFGSPPAERGFPLGIP